MIQVNSHELAEDFEIEIGEPFTAPGHLEVRVFDIWQKEKMIQGDRLTNGTIYSLLEHNDKLLSIQSCEFQFVLAGRRDSSLAGDGLLVRPVAVTGIVFCAEGLVLGRRGGGVSDDVGLWEPVPAGGLAQENPERQMYEELAEELGLSADMVNFVKACGLVEDTSSRVFDIVYRVNTSLMAEDVFNAHRLCKTAEHSELAIVKEGELNSFLKTNSENLLPALPSMLRIAGLIEN